MVKALATTRLGSTEEHARHWEPGAPLAAGEIENSVAALQGVQEKAPESAKLLFATAYEKVRDRPALPGAHVTL